MSLAHGFIGLITHFVLRCLIGHDCGQLTAKIACEMESGGGKTGHSRSCEGGVLRKIGKSASEVLRSR